MLYYAKSGCSRPLIARLYGEFYSVGLLIELIIDITLTILASIYNYKRTLFGLKDAFV
jgi:hypothetical protein